MERDDVAIVKEFGECLELNLTPSPSNSSVESVEGGKLPLGAEDEENLLLDLLEVVGRMIDSTFTLDLLDGLEIDLQTGSSHT